LSPAAVASLHTPLGELWVGSSPSGVVASSFDERTFIEELMALGFDAMVHGAPEAATTLALRAKEELTAYFARRLKTFTVPIECGGETAFGQAVLQEVAHHIGFGRTATYAEVGERAGRLRAARAVGNILANCPFSVIVPCHRVVHAGRTPEERGDRDGHFSSRKAWLLRFEREVLSDDGVAGDEERG